MWLDWLGFCDCVFHSVCPLMEKDKKLIEAWRDWLRGEGLLLMGRAMLSKSLIQFSVDGWGCVPSLLSDLRPNYGGGDEDNSDLLQKAPCRHCCTQWPPPCSRPPPTHTPAGDSWTLMGKSGSISCGVTASSPGSGAHKILFVPSKSLFPQSCVSKFWRLWG